MFILPVAAVFSEKLASAWTEWSVLLIAVLPTLAFTLLQIWSASLAKAIGHVRASQLLCFIALDRMAPAANTFNTRVASVVRFSLVQCTIIQFSTTP